MHDLTFALVPEAPPQDVYANVIDSRSVKVFWKPPPKRKKNGEIVYYKIIYSKLDEASSEFDDNGINEAQKVEEVKVEPQLNSYILDKLDEWTEYKIKVLAGTKVGDGPASEPFTLRTEEAGMFSFSLYYLLFFARFFPYVHFLTFFFLIIFTLI